MDDTISRQAAIDALGEEPEVWTGKDEYAQGLNNQWHYDVNALKALPSAERRGRWIESEIENEKYVCSVCGGACWYYDYQGEVAKSNYCPNCGAKMVNEDE